MLVILPLKDLVLAKQRLSGVLSHHERRALFQAMVGDVLAALVASGRVSDVLLVSDDPTAPMLAAHHGVAHWQESALTGAAAPGLNATLTAVTSRLVATGVTECMVIHGDLPLLSAAEVDAFIAAHQQSAVSHKVTINPDSAGTGTNVMALTPPDIVHFEYGSQSAQLHGDQALDAGAELKHTRYNGMNLDVDDFDDLLSLLDSDAQDCALATRQFLEESGIAARLRLIAEDGAVNDGLDVNMVQHYE